VTEIVGVLCVFRAPLLVTLLATDCIRFSYATSENILKETLKENSEILAT
jgi:hypothetical protein